METSLQATNSGTSLLNHQLVPYHEEDYDEKRDNVYCYDFPPGVRFEPRDDELIEEYLMKKIFKKPVPMHVINEADVYQYDPAVLANLYGGDEEKDKEDMKMHYFFTSRSKKYPQGHRPSRSTPGGYWKATGIDKKIHSQKTERLIGLKKTLVFYMGKSPKGMKTKWIMHEFMLEKKVVPTTRPSKENMELDDVLVRIYNRAKQESENNDVNEKDEQVVISESSETEQDINFGSSPVVGENHIFCDSDVDFGDEYEGDAILDLINGNPDMERGVNELYEAYSQTPNPSWSNFLAAEYNLSTEFATYNLSTEFQQPCPVAMTPVEYPMMNGGYFFPPSIRFNTI